MSGNLITNGSFENSVVGWDLEGISISVGGANISEVHYTEGSQTNGGPDLFDDGTQSLAIGGILFIGISPRVKQTITLVPGENYILSFAIRSLGLVGANIITYINLTGTNLETQLINLQLLGNNQWGTFEFPFTATNSSTTLSFYNLANISLIYTYYIDAISIYQVAAPCYSWRSLVRVKNILSGQVDDIMVKDVYSDEHLVFRTDTDEYIPIVYNAKSGTTRRYRKFVKDVFGPGKPTHDFFITSGHRMMIDGVNIKAGRLKEGVKAGVKNDQLYTIVTEETCPIWINGLDVMTYNEKEFTDYVTKKHIKWINNKQP